MIRMLNRIEEACATVVERAFARAFPSDVQPAQIARKLVATLEARATPASRYAVRLHPRDYERLAVHRRELEAQWSEMIEEMAQRMHVPLASPAVVTIESDASVIRGAVAVETRTVGDDASRPPTEPRSPPGEPTWVPVRPEPRPVATPTPEPPRHTEPATLALRVRRGVTAGDPRHPVIGAPVVVGRSAACDLVLLNDPRVSRRHAAVAPDVHGLALTDLGSSNGTYVNGRRVTRTLLRPGDAIRLGDSELVVEVDGGGASETR